MTDTQKEMLLKFEIYLKTTPKDVLDEKIKELESFNSTINIKDYFDNFHKNFNQ